MAPSIFFQLALLTFQALLGPRPVRSNSSLAEVSQSVAYPRPAKAAAAVAPSPSASNPQYWWNDLFPLEQYLNGTTLPPQTLVNNYTIRYVGKDLAVPAKRVALLKLLKSSSIVEDTEKRTQGRVEFLFRPGVPAERLDSGLTGRKLKQSDSVEVSSNDIFQDMASIDVEMLTYALPGSKVLATFSAGPVKGFLKVLLAEKGIDVMPVGINLTYSNAMLNLPTPIPFPPIYITGSVIQISSPGFIPLNIETENLLLVTLREECGSALTFLQNRIQSVKKLPDGSARIGFFTYTSRAIANISELGCDSVKQALASRMQLAGNFTVDIIASVPIGRRSEELMGNPKFSVQLIESLDKPQPSPVVRGVDSAKDSVSPAAAAGIALGAALVSFLAAGLGMLIAANVASRKRRLKNGLPEKQPSNLTRLAHTSGHSPAALLGSKGKTSVLGGGAAQYLENIWTIAPGELTICQKVDGKDWILGKGATGIVYRGKRGHVQDVAIKVIELENTAVQVFEKELAMLRHLNLDRNLVQFYGACMLRSQLMLVFEYMEGGDLAEALENDFSGAFGWYNEGARILLDVARGLHFLHSNKVAHRDLKSKNVLLTASGEAKIGDVGMAKLVGNQILASTWDGEGTFAYAAPELLASQRCDHRVDIYSFGVLMWEVVTHEIPARGDLRDIQTPAEAPLEVAELIAWCMERSLEKRPTAKQIFSVIHALLSDPAASSP